MTRQNEWSKAIANVAYKRTTIPLYTVDKLWNFVFKGSNFATGNHDIWESIIIGKIMVSLKEECGHK